MPGLGPGALGHAACRREHSPMAVTPRGPGPLLKGLRADPRKLFVASAVAPRRLMQ